MTVLKTAFWASAGLLVYTHAGYPAGLAALLGAGEAESAAPDQIVTPRAASHLGHRWAL